VTEKLKKMRGVQKLFQEKSQGGKKSGEKKKIEVKMYTRFLLSPGREGLEYL